MKCPILILGTPSALKSLALVHCTCVVQMFQGFKEMNVFKSIFRGVGLQSAHTHRALSRQQLVGSVFVQAEVIRQRRR